MASRTLRNLTSILVMRNSLGQSYSRGVELSHAEISRLLPDRTNYNLITSAAFRASAPDGSVSTLALSECEKMIRAGKGTTHTHSLFIGGDHLTSMCTILASLKVHGKNFKLLWMDAHADIHNQSTSPSKNRHGMVVNMLINHTYAGIPRLDPSQIMYIGLRSTESDSYRSRGRSSDQPNKQLPENRGFCYGFKYAHFFGCGRSRSERNDRDSNPCAERGLSGPSSHHYGNRQFQR